MRPILIAAGTLLAIVVSGAWPDAVTASDKNSSQSQKAPSPSGNKKDEPQTTFQGEVVKVAAGTANEGKIWVKHANGTIDVFHVHKSTKLSGAPALSALTKGSMVTVVATKKKAVSVAVSKLAAPAPPDKASGQNVTGTVVKVHTDSYGDSGNISVKTPKGTVQQFQVTNATVVDHPDHKDFVHTMQFIAVGQTVNIEHDGGKIALLIAVTATPKK
jgi:hypothetical protein